MLRCTGSTTDREEGSSRCSACATGRARRPAS